MDYTNNRLLFLLLLLFVPQKTRKPIKSAIS